MPNGARLIDATGKIVMPGGIDPHVHCKWHLPNPDGSAALTDPPDVVGRAAVHGGTTTMIDFTRASQGANVQDAIEKREEDWKGHCACDYAQHIMVEGALPLDLPGQLAEAIQAGFPTVKIFTTDITPSRKGRMVDFGDIWEVFQVLKANGGLGVIHSEDNDIVMHMYGKLIREGRTGFANMAEVHNTLSEDISFRRVIRLAEKVGADALHDAHLGRVRRVGDPRGAGARRADLWRVAASVHALYVRGLQTAERPDLSHLSVAEVGRGPGGAVGRHAGRRINCVATDEICCTLAKKLQGVRIDDTTGGNAGVEPRVALMYTEMVGKRGYSLSRYVDLVSTNAAKIMGLYPRKGALAAGSDADICVLDPADKRVIRAAGSARGGLHAMGRPQDGGMAVPDRSARQGGGGERHVEGLPGGRQVAASQSCGGVAGRAAAVGIGCWDEPPPPLAGGRGRGRCHFPGPLPHPLPQGDGENWAELRACCSTA